MLFLIKRIAGADYGEYQGFVVCAASEEAARRFVHDQMVADEFAHLEKLAQTRTASFMNKDKTVFSVTEEERQNARDHETVWLRSDQSSCSMIPIDGDNEIILADFNNG